MGFFLVDALNQRQVAFEQHNGFLCFKANQSHLPRVAIISTPKAGTYLVGRLLENLGWIDSEVHASRDSFTDYRNLTVEEKRADPTRLEVNLSINFTASLVGPGQFLVGHLPCDEKTIRSLNGYKIFFLYREMRASFVSWIRFLIAGNRLNSTPDRGLTKTLTRESLISFLDSLGESYFAMASAAAHWITYPDAVKISFETLMGDHGQEQLDSVLRELAQSLGLDGIETLRFALSTTRGQSTKTYSGDRTLIEEYWSQEAEQIFIEKGLYNINGLLGI